jgi:colanic acid/amylovoran biosynthesis glycosyltransferase
VKPPEPRRPDRSRARQARDASECVIAYLARILPVLSETFVVREIAALRRLGLVVRPFSLYRPEPGSVHPELPALRDEVEVLVRPLHPLYLLAHLLYAARRPARYAGCLRRYVLGSGAPHGRLRALAQFSAAPFAALRLRRAGVTHIHAHFANTAAGVAMMAAFLEDLPFSFTAHAYDLFVDDLLLPAKLSAAAFIVTISEFNAAYLREHYPEARSADLHVIHCGVDPDRFTPRPRRTASPPAVLAVGRLVVKKGFHVLIEACALLRDQGVRARCVIAGDGEEAARLRALAAKLDLSTDVILTGALLPADLLEYYAQADVFVMPSCPSGNDRDGIPNVLIEAMAMEIPVVSTRLSGIPELVRHGETGLLVRPDDPPGLAAAVARLLGDPVLGLRLGRAARELVVRDFNIRSSARRLFTLFTGQPR